MPKAKSTKGKHSPRLTPRQRKLITLIPLVEASKLTMTEALKRAGYAESTASQQQSVLGSLRENVLMQAALEKAGFTKEYLATGIMEGTAAFGHGDER